MDRQANSPVSMDDVARYFNAPAAPSALTNAEMIAVLTEVRSWARDLPIPTPGAISAMQKVRTVRDALAAAPVAAQAGQVAPAQPLAMVSPDELPDIQAGRGAVPVRGNQWRDDQAVPIYAAAVAGQVAVPEDVRKALQTIARWDLPATGKTWPSGGAVSYEAEYGSNGARDYMRQVALNALAALDVPPAVAQQAAAQAQSAPAESLECWSHNEEDFNARSLDELIHDHDLQPGATVWVGEAVHPEPKSLFNTDWLIESMGEAAYDIGGEHAGEDYPNVSDEQVAELEALIVGWIAKCAPPNFWTVKNVRAHVLTAEDCGAQASTPDVRQEGGPS